MLIDWMRSGQSELAPEKQGVVVNISEFAVLERELSARFKARRGFCLATLNLDHVVKLRDDSSFHAAYLAHDFVTADGNPIVWLSKIAKSPVSLMAGADLIWPIVDLAASSGIRVALLGSTAETLERSARQMRERHPNLEIVACIAPPMEFDPTGELADTYIAELAKADAGLCFLALGAPKQELFAAHAATRADRIGFVSIGAGLDFIAGQQKRAPAIVRKFAAEWLWRLMSNPRRLGVRYARCVAVMPRLIWFALKVRLENHKDT